MARDQINDDPTLPGVWNDCRTHELREDTGSDWFVWQPAPGCRVLAQSVDLGIKGLVGGGDSGVESDTERGCHVSLRSGRHAPRNENAPAGAGAPRLIEVENARRQSSRTPRRVVRRSLLSSLKEVSYAVHPSLCPIAGRVQAIVVAADDVTPYH